MTRRRQRQKKREQFLSASRIAGQFALADRRQSRIGQDDEITENGHGPAHLADRRRPQRASDIDADDKADDQPQRAGGEHGEEVRRDASPVGGPPDRLVRRCRDVSHCLQRNT
jgi:hypothetical protein